jgi:hypothetical protein
MRAPPTRSLGGRHRQRRLPTAPYAAATTLTLSVPRPARFLSSKLPNLLHSYRSKWFRYEGQYLEITDAHGRRMFEAGISTRLGGGGLWVRRALRTCLPTDMAGIPPARPRREAEDSPTVPGMKRFRWMN